MIDKCDEKDTSNLKQIGQEASIQYAPILIPTLCRFTHLVRCIESLKRNTWAKYTDVYVGLDYPVSDSHWSGYRKICSYLDGDFSEFASFHVIRHEKNMGCAENMRTLRELISKKYDRFIRTDDDVEFSPNFLEYMDKALTYYETDEDVIAVTGYAHPIELEHLKKTTVIKQKLSAPMWGTGFWIKKYEKIRQEIIQGVLIEEFERVRKAKFSGMLDATVNDYILSYTRENPSTSVLCRVTDVTLRIYLNVQNKYVASPTLSKARNWGYDGSGVSCPDNNIRNTSEKHADAYLFREQPIDQEKSFLLQPGNHTEAYFLQLNRFEKRHISQKMTAYVRLLLLLLLGREKYVKLIRSLKKWKR